MNIKTEVLIIGGGVPGLSLARKLSENGIKTILVEAAPEPDLTKPLPLKALNRTVAVMVSSMALLHGVLGADKPEEFTNLQAAPLEKMRMLEPDLSGNKIYLDKTFASTDLDLPFFAVNVPLQKLVRALTAAINKSDLPLQRFYDCRLKSFETTASGVTAELTNGTIIDAKLIVGADGRNSQVRSTAGIDVWEKSYGQSAFTCILNHSKPHNNTSTEFHYRGGPFTLVPLPDNQSSLVWVEPTARLEATLKTPKADIEHILGELSHHILGKLEMATAPDLWPLITLKAKSLTASRVALIAEAAHVSSPLGAQGLNLSLRDAEALAEAVLNAAKAGMDIGSRTTLQSYEQNRKNDVAGRVFGIHSIHESLSAKGNAVHWLRRSGIRAADAISPLRRALMRTGMGY